MTKGRRGRPFNQPGIADKLFASGGVESPALRRRNESYAEKEGI